MDELDKFVAQNSLTLENILKYIDDYSIYSFYIGQELEVGEKYSSPLRPGDEDPSFALFYSSSGTGDLLFKDHALGISGNVLLFVKELLDITYKEALMQINCDFDLGFSNTVMQYKPRGVKRSYKKLKRAPLELRITKRKAYSKAFKQYWFDLLDISKEVLDEFYVSDVLMAHYIRGQEESVVRSSTLCTAYEINGYYKLYYPFEKKLYKFRNNYPYGYVEGGLQLRWNKPFAIITKSTKEILFFRQHFDWDAIAGTSENNMINPLFLKKVFKQYPIVFVWLDNDAPGIRAQKKYLEKYPQIVPIDPSNRFGEKDPTDMYLHNQDKKQEVLSFINNTIKTKLFSAEQTK